MLICLDFDGVIVNSLDHHVHLAQIAQEKLGAGRVPTRQDFQEIDSLTYEGFARWLEIPEDRLEAWRTIHMGLVTRDGQVSDVFPEIPAVMKALAERHTLAIVTSNIEEIVRGTLRRAGIEDTVTLLYDGYYPGSKAARIRDAMVQTSSEPNHTFMVGDTRSDISEGRLAGVRTVAVGWGFQSKKVLDMEQPDYFAVKPDSLLEIFS